jgi:hypothetical protein
MSDSVARDIGLVLDRRRLLQTRKVQQSTAVPFRASGDALSQLYASLCSCRLNAIMGDSVADNAERLLERVTLFDSRRLVLKGEAAPLKTRAHTLCLKISHQSPENAHLAHPRLTRQDLGLCLAAPRRTAIGIAVE